MLFKFIFSNFLFTYFVFCSGSIFAKILKIDNQKKYILLFGIIFLSIVSLLLNFFIPLNKMNNTIVLILIFLFSFYFFNIEIFKKNISFIFFITLINILLILGSNHYRPDAFIYHLPYVATLNENKIIIGLVNLNYRFGHTSIIQYFSAISNNYIFGHNGISLYLPMIFSACTYYFLEEIKKKNNFLIFLSTAISLVFLIKAYRVSEYGNDYYGHFFYLIIFYLFVKIIYEGKINYNKFFIISLFSLFTFFNKISLGVCIIFIIVIIVKYKKYNFVLKKKTFVFILFFLIFILKNLLISGCALYPLKKTCLDNISWTPKTGGYGDPEQVTTDTEAWAKSWPDYFKKKNYNKKQLNQNEYIANFNWTPSWYETHFKILLNKILPILIIFFLLMFCLKKNNFNRPSNNKKLNFIILFSSLFGSLIWFLKFPLYRFGFSIIISTILSILILFNIKTFDKKKKNLLKYITLACVLFFLTQNMKKIYLNSNDLIPSIRGNDNIETIRNNELIVQNLSNINNCGFVSKCSNKKFSGNIKTKYKYEIYFYNSKL